MQTDRSLSADEKMAMGLQPVTSAVFLIANSLLYNVGVSEEYLRCLCTLSGIKRGWCVRVCINRFVVMSNFAYF
jgi:hypothetical protein